MTILLAIFLTAQAPATTAQTPPAATQAKPPVTTQSKPPATTPPAATTQAPPRQTATTTTGNGRMVIRVTDRIGTPTIGAHVVAEGPSQREGSTDGLGTVTFRTLTSGTYRVRAEGDGLIALEKEIIIRNTLPLTSEFALSAAPPLPSPPAPAPTPAPPPPVAVAPAPAPRPVYPPGEAKVLSIPDLAERSLPGREPVKTVSIGCSGASNAALVIVRENIPATSSNTADQMMYLVAGEAALTLSGKEQVLSPGWFGIVPHGTSYAVTRRGRNPAVLLAVVAGEPCSATR